MSKKYRLKISSKVFFLKERGENLTVQGGVSSHAMKQAGPRRCFG